MLGAPRPPADKSDEPHAQSSGLPAVLTTILDALPIGLALLDARGHVVFCNRTECERSGFAMDWLHARDYFRDVLPALEKGGAGERFRSVVAREQRAICEEVMIPQVMGDRTLRINLLPVEGPEPVRAMALVEEVTELLRERERRERAERLAAVGEVAAGVAHEVNNPLASIKSFAQLLARDATNREQREALELIINESTRVAGIVDNLLSFARRQGAGGREPVNLSAVAERVLHMQRYALETAGIHVRRDFDAALSPVMGESGALQQVVLNLVVNAEQALAGKQGERRLIIRTRESTEGVILSVVDNGPGIPRELLPQVFERFRTTKAGGTGLGLGISAAIIRDHSGQIWAESDEGRGAAFYVRIPRADDPLKAVEPVPQTAPPEVAPLRKLRILIADDEQALRLALSLFLSRRGHTVIQAPDAYVAYDLAGSQPFDVALVDARMPGDGLDLIEKLEALPGLHGRTALMTGDLGRARTRQGIATGRPYLTKPFDMDEMVRLLETLAG
jgi:signal transduction histidine kinase/CheY-like chemotaxis protein